MCTATETYLGDHHEQQRQNQQTPLRHRRDGAGAGAGGLAGLARTAIGVAVALSAGDATDANTVYEIVHTGAIVAQVVHTVAVAVTQAGRTGTGMGSTQSDTGIGENVANAILVDETTGTAGTADRVLANARTIAGVGGAFVAIVRTGRSTGSVGQHVATAGCGIAGLAGFTWWVARLTGHRAQ